MSAWWQQRMVGFDLETTGPLPEEARIVTASIAEVGGDELPTTVDWMADPGVEIPHEAAEIHGISTERARAEGQPAADVVRAVVERLEANLRLGRPIVIFNARYDLTVLDRECRRHRIVPLTERRVPLLVVDPFVIDKWLDRFRKGSRKLEAVCERYGARLDEAHASDADAIAAARTAWVLGAKGRVIRNIRPYARQADLAELRALNEEWERVRYDLTNLHDAQRRWALVERERFAEYKAGQGDHEDAARIRAEVGWPVLDVMAHETRSAAA